MIPPPHGDPLPVHPKTGLNGAKLTARPTQPVLTSYDLRSEGPELARGPKIVQRGTKSRLKNGKHLAKRSKKRLKKVVLAYPSSLTLNRVSVLHSLKGDGATKYCPSGLKKGWGHGTTGPTGFYTYALYQHAGNEYGDHYAPGVNHLVKKVFEQTFYAVMLHLIEI